MDEKRNNFNENEKQINKVETNDNSFKEKEANNNVDPYKSRKALIYCCFAFIGLFNNLGYTLMITGAQQFSSKVKNDALIAFYPFALIALNTVARFINSRCLIRLSYFKRILGLSIYFGSGYISLFLILMIIDNVKDFNNTLAFLLTLIPTIIMGTGQCLGEATFLGYIRTFPEDYISGWSCGTGIAGVAAALLSLTFKLIGESFDLKYLYIIVAPVSILFFFAYFITHKIKTNIDAKLVKEEENTENVDNSNEIEIERKTGDTLNNMNQIPNRPTELLQKNTYSNKATDVSLNEELSCKNFVLGFKYGRRYIINMFIVYFLEYTVCTGFCERANYFGYVDSKGTFYEKAQYETFLLFYQIGVVLSRSSLFIFKYLKFVEILNIIQFCNFVFWFLEALLGIVSNQIVCFITLILLGLCGGGVYVGCFYFVLNDIRIPPQYKELVLNIATLFNDMGVLLSSILCVIFDNTFLKNKIK